MIVPRLHVLAACAHLEHPAADAVLAGCADRTDTVIHIRDRTASGRQLCDAVYRVRQAGARCFLNDRIDVAVAAEADGVHLPALGLPTVEARTLAPHLTIGRSTHSVTETQAAASGGADYTFLGQVFETASHPGVAPLGLPTTELPAGTIAIGGITADNVTTCLAAGFHGVAMISAIWEAPDPAAIVPTMQVLLNDEQH